jgi:hypothetical protein
MSNNVILLMLLPVVAACICLLLTAALIVSLHYYPQYGWNMHCIAWSSIALALSTKYLRRFAPMLLMWAFWFALQGEIQTYWRLVDSGLLPAVQFDNRLYTISVIGLAALGNCLHFERFRTPTSLILATTLHSLLLVLVPKPRISKEYLALQQVAAYAALYLAGHVVFGVYAQKTAVPSMATLLATSWVLWVPSSMAIIASTSAQLLVMLIILLQNYDALMRFTALEGVTAARQLNAEDPKQE